MDTGGNKLELTPTSVASTTHIFVFQLFNRRFEAKLTFGLMLLTRQKARCFWMLSMLWQCCLLVVRRYFCRDRAMEGNMARAASRTSMMSDGVVRSSSFFIRRTCVKASSTATTSLRNMEHTHSSERTVSSHTPV